jgi:Cytidylate kinase-like family
MTKILTIEREYGSGAAEIARKLADRLGWKLWDQLLTDEIARQMECDREHIEKRGERIDPLYYRLLKSFLRGSFEGNLNVPQMQMADAEGIRRVAEQLVMAAAKEGNAVIVGACHHPVEPAPTTQRRPWLMRRNDTSLRAIRTPNLLVSSQRSLPCECRRHRLQPH